MMDWSIEIALESVGLKVSARTAKAMGFVVHWAADDRPWTHEDTRGYRRGQRAEDIVRAVEMARDQLGDVSDARVARRAIVYLEAMLVSGDAVQALRAGLDVRHHVRVEQEVLSLSARDERDEAAS